MYGRQVQTYRARGWLQPCATSELSIVGAQARRALDQASRAHEKKIQIVSRSSGAAAGLGTRLVQESRGLTVTTGLRTFNEGITEGSGSLGLASCQWAHNLLARMGLEARGTSQTMDLC